MAGQAQRGYADQRRDEYRYQSTDRRPGDRRQAEMRVAGDRRVGAGAEEHGVPDRDLTGVAPDQVPGGSTEPTLVH